MLGYQLDRPGTTDEVRRVRAELVGRARELVPLLARNAEKIEKNCRLVEENVTAIRDAGLFKVTQPKGFGGYETDVRTLGCEAAASKPGRPRMPRRLAAGPAAAAGSMPSRSADPAASIGITTASGSSHRGDSRRTRLPAS